MTPAPALQTKERNPTMTILTNPERAKRAAKSISRYGDDIDEAILELQSQVEAEVEAEIELQTEE